jgi:hypothetical protein
MGDGGGVNLWPWFQAIDVDHHGLRALPIHACTKAFNAAARAKQVLNGLGVEPVFGKIVLPAQKREISGRHGLHDPAQAAAARTIAIAQRTLVGLRLPAHRAAMALAEIGLFIAHDDLL